MPSSDKQNCCNKATENVTNSKQIITKNVSNHLKDQGINADKHLWDYEEVLNKLGFGKTQWILLIASGLVTMTSISTLFSAGIVSISSQCEFRLTQQQKGIMMAACMTGIVLSTYVWGCLSDVWGRRTVLISSMFITNFLQVVLMFIINIWFYNIINLFIGISLGGVLGAIFPYLSELSPGKYRSIMINYSTMFISLTVIYIPAISWLVLSSNWSLQLWNSFVFKPWRLILLFNMLPGFIGGLMLLALPESPKLLLAQYKYVKAVEAFQWMTKLNTGSNLQAILKTSQINFKPEETLDDKLPAGFSVLLNIWKATKPLFCPPHGLSVGKAVLAFTAMMLTSAGLQVWFPEIINKSVESSGWGNGSDLCKTVYESYEHIPPNGVTNEICTDFISSQTYINNIIMGVAYLSGFFVQGLLMRYFSIKSILVGSLTVAAFCGILLHFVTSPVGIIILLCLYILLPGLGVSVMCGILVELVPVYLRGKTVSIAFTLGRLGSIMSTNLIAVMLKPYCTEIFAIFTIIIFVSGGVIYYLPIK